MTCNKPVSISFTWRGFISGGSRHRDGWGVAFYPDGVSACLIKEPRPSTSSLMARFLKSADLIRSKIVISHVRTASKGSVTYCNTHPFVRELFGREWVFAHNGTIIEGVPRPRFYEPIDILWKPHFLKCFLNQQQNLQFSLLLYLCVELQRKRWRDDPILGSFAISPAIQCANSRIKPSRTNAAFISTSPPN